MNNPENITVGIIYPGNRANQMIEPLQTTDMNIIVEPKRYSDCDIVVADNADRDLGKEVLKKHFHNAKLVYRMRGDLYRELETWKMNRIKKWAAEWVVTQVDGAICVNSILAEKIYEKSGVWAGKAELAIDYDSWPTINHGPNDSELRCITLGNSCYQRKTEPLIWYANTVEQVLSQTGGSWLIYTNEGDYTYMLEESLGHLNHVHYMGETSSPKMVIQDRNLMLHFSNLDGIPNAILEGMATGLPVITNDFEAFRRYNYEHDNVLNIFTTDEELREQLRYFTFPTRRDNFAALAYQNIMKYHTFGYIGRQYQDYFLRLLS